MDKLKRAISFLQSFRRKDWDFEPGNYLLTNDSSLWDFNDEEEASNEVHYRKIMLLYGVGVSDIEPPTIASIARRIHESRSAG